MQRCVQGIKIPASAGRLLKFAFLFQIDDQGDKTDHGKHRSGDRALIAIGLLEEAIRLIQGP